VTQARTKAAETRADAAQIGKLDRLFTAQKAAVARDPVPPLAERLARLAALREMVAANRQRFRDSMAADFGSIHPRIVDMMDTGPVIGRVEYFEANLAAWMSPRQIAPGPEHGASTAEIHHVPKGVNGNISPWNFPVESALVMCTDMIAAGNTVIVKPSELAPATAQALDDVVAERFDPEVLAVVQGGPALAEAFAAMPWDHLTFTGSPRVGRLVMQAAARNLVPVTLELGGKNPAVFAPDGVTEELVHLFLTFRTLKAGQVCTSPDYVMVPRDRLEAWVATACNVWRRTYPAHVGHPFATGIINEMHFARVLGYLEEARARGVRVIGLNADEPDPALRQVPTTLVIDPPDDLGCMTEEIFGPVIPVVPYDTFEEAMVQINAGPSPLASYVATHDAHRAQQFVTQVRSGGAAVNDFGMQGGHVALPFGGVGRSGHGCHSGHEGFLGYSHTKSVFYGANDSFVHEVLAPQPGDLSVDAGSTVASA